LVSGPSAARVRLNCGWESSSHEAIYDCCGFMNIPLFSPDSFYGKGSKTFCYFCTGRLERAQWGKKAAMDRSEQLDNNYLEQICWAQIPPIFQLRSQASIRSCVGSDVAKFPLETFLYFDGMKSRILKFGLCCPIDLLERLPQWCALKHQLPDLGDDPIDPPRLKLVLVYSSSWGDAVVRSSNWKWIATSGVSLCTIPLLAA